MIRKKKKFAWPRKLYDKPRILEENKLVEQYGLKNKREIWKAEAKIKYFRNRAKALITADSGEQEKFFKKLKQIGIDVNTVADVLALNKEDLLKRRLPSVLVKKELANTPKQGRQMVVHKRVLINGKAINVPGYIVKTEEEKLITIKPKVKKTQIEKENSEVNENE